ncbi:hypothetical protein HN51_022464 [Arachis hypogaea]
MNLQSPISPRKDVVQNRCLEFMQLIKVHQLLYKHNTASGTYDMYLDSIFVSL